MIVTIKKEVFDKKYKNFTVKFYGNPNLRQFCELLFTISIDIENKDKIFHAYAEIYNNGVGEYYDIMKIKSKLVFVGSEIIDYVFSKTHKSHTKLHFRCDGKNCADLLFSLCNIIPEDIRKDFNKKLTDCLYIRNANK